MKKINIDKEDFNKLFRLNYLIEVSKFRWIFSYDDYFLKEYLKYYRSKSFRGVLLNSVFL